MAYDVFISFKNTDSNGNLTADRAIAERLFYLLRNKGIKVFFSEKDVSDSQFISEINTALEQAKVFVLVSTSLKHVDAQWVKFEWQNFIGGINSGKKKNSQLITLLSGITARDLPLMLSNFQSYDVSIIDDCVSFIEKMIYGTRNHTAAPAADTYIVRKPTVQSEKNVSKQNPTHDKPKKIIAISLIILIFLIPTAGIVFASLLYAGNWIKGIALFDYLQSIPFLQPLESKYFGDRMISELNVFIPAMIISFCGCALIMFAIAIEKKHLYLYLIMFVYAGMLLPGITYTIAKESFLIVLVVNLISVIYNVVLVYFSFSEEAKEHSFLERTPIRTIAKIPASAVAFTFFEFLVKFVVTKL